MLSQEGAPYDILGFVVLTILALVFAQMRGNRGGVWYLPSILVLGVFLRALGSTVRYEIIIRVYGGTGDARSYYYDGQHLSSRTGGLLTLDYWFDGRWWGTDFITRISGLITTLIGPTIRGEFLLFSLFGFLGLVAMAIAFHNVQPGKEAANFAHLAWIWPSLWFWPSSVGKEALLVLAIGLAVLGYAGKQSKMSLLPYVAGMALAFSIRPHVAAVLAAATAVAYWLGTWKGWSFRRAVEGIAMLAVASVAIFQMQSQLGFDADLEGIQDFVSHTAGQTLSGGSKIQPATLGPAGIPVAFMNVWMRPFPWEAHNMTALVASGEIVLLWALIFYRRKAVWMALRFWRQHRLLQFALPFLFFYTMMIGLAFANLGIIARQRAPIFPFMLMLITVVPATWEKYGPPPELTGKEP